MNPNPLVLWGITGSIPAGSPARRRAVLTVENAPPSGAGQPHGMPAAGLHSPCSSAGRQPVTTDLQCGTGVGRAVLAVNPRSTAETLPVQGRVNVREQGSDGTSSDPSSQPGSSGINGLAAGASAAIDDEISAVVPAGPAQGAPEDMPQNGGTQTPAPRPALPGMNESVMRPVLIASIAVVSAAAGMGAVIYAVWRRRQRKQKRQGLLGSDPGSLYNAPLTNPMRPDDWRASMETPRGVGLSPWSELSRQDVSHTEVQSIEDGEAGSDCSFGGRRAILPPSQDSMIFVDD